MIEPPSSQELQPVQSPSPWIEHQQQQLVQSQQQLVKRQPQQMVHPQQHMVQPQPQQLQQLQQQVNGGVNGGCNMIGVSNFQGMQRNASISMLNQLQQNSSISSQLGMMGQQQQQNSLIYEHMNFS